MALFKSGNPILKENTFEEFQDAANEDNVMTLQGTINKTGFLLLTVMIPALFVWDQFNVSKDFSSIAPYFIVGILGGFITGLILSFNKQLAAYLSVIYAALEGLALGGLSVIMDYRYPGIVIEALVLTFGILACLLVIYKLEIIKPSENFKLIVASSTAGIGVYYLISIVLSFFGVVVPLINDNSTVGIIFSLVVVIIASMNLVVDFDFIEQGVANKVPKYMEWYSAFGLMVTLIWLYIELLRLLAKSRSK
jgi:uncharacterized YccA/Bax inhibitor family protein